MKKQFIALGAAGAVTLSGVGAASAIASPKNGDKPAPTAQSKAAPGEKQQGDKKANPRDAFAQKLAAALGVDKAKLLSALETVKTQGESAREAALQSRQSAMAKELGVTPQQLLSALQSGVTFPRGGDLRSARLDLAKVAKTLGVTEAKLQEAFRASAPKKGERPSKDSFAASLAKALGVEEAKVKAALQSVGKDMPHGEKYSHRFGKQRHHGHGKPAKDRAPGESHRGAKDRG